jgi:hypothetical protein
MTEDREAQEAPRRKLVTVCGCIFLAAAFVTTALVVPMAWPWRFALLVVMLAGYWALFPSCRFRGSGEENSL